MKTQVKLLLFVIGYLLISSAVCAFDNQFIKLTNVISDTGNMNEGNANSRRFEGKFTVSLGTSTPENIYRHTSKNISLKIIASFQHQQNSSSGVFS